MSKVINALSLSRRAGKLAMGFSAAEKALRAKQAFLVVVTSDIAGGTIKKITRLAGDTRLVGLPCSKGDIEAVMKRGFAVAAVTDMNFKELVLKALKEDMHDN